MGRPPPFDSPVSGENIAAVLVDSLSNGGADATDDWDEPNVTTQHKSNCHPGVTVRAWLGRAGGVGVGVCDCPARPPVQWERVGGL